MHQWAHPPRTSQSVPISSSSSASSSARPIIAPSPTAEEMARRNQEFLAESSRTGNFTMQPGSPQRELLLSPSPPTRIVQPDLRVYTTTTGLNPRDPSMTSPYKYLTSPTSPRRSTPQAKLYHMNSERRRRQRMNELFEQLREGLGAPREASKIEVLRLAVERITGRETGEYRALSGSDYDSFPEAE